MKTWARGFIFLVMILIEGAAFGAEEVAVSKKVYIVPIKEDIMPALTYLVRRGVKDAMEAKADTLILDMETNGGRVDVTRDIIAIIEKFNGRTVTYVNRTAFSAGAFIAVSTKEIYMAPQSVIGAAAPILMSPGGGGAAEMPDTVERKMTSAVRAMVRTSAEKNGHNVDVVEAMIDKTRELKIDGEVLNEKGQILTLTNVQAEKEYGNPPKRLLSSGTFESMDALIAHLGLADAKRVEVQPTGAEKVGTFLEKLAPLLLIVGIIGVYIELKTPGFGLPGIVGITAFTIYFLGGYIAGLSGIEWLAVFIIGLALLFLELLVFPGTLALGIAGAGLMLVALIMALVDVYPGMPTIPTMPQLRLPLQTLGIAAVGSAVAVLALARVLPETPIFRRLVSTTASGEISTAEVELAQNSRVGQVGVAISQLRPGGKAQFGEEIVDVITQGELLPKGTQVRVIRHSGPEAVVEPA
jgi:membrane-bound serine protease (ClpP class)